MAVVICTCGYLQRGEPTGVPVAVVKIKLIQCNKITDEYLQRGVPMGVPG